MRTTPAWRTLAVIGAVGALLATGMAPAAAAIPTGNFDLRALGARIKGAVGDQAEIKIGFRNDGPTAPDRSETGTPVTIVDVTMPKGTSAVAIPAECQQHANPGATIYRCESGPVVAVGQTVTFPFTLRIDAADAEGGSVRINVRCECDSATIDLNSGNDTAPIEINVSGGGLHLTGAAWGVIAGGGGLLVVAAAVALVIAWRRRNRAEDEDADGDAEVGTDADAEAGAEVGAEPAVRPEVGAEADAAVGTESPVGTESAARTDVGTESAARTDVGTESAARTDVGAKSAVRPEVGAESPVGAETGAGGDPQAAVAVDAEADSKA